MSSGWVFLLDDIDAQLVKTSLDAPDRNGVLIRVKPGVPLAVLAAKFRHAADVIDQHAADEMPL